MTQATHPDLGSVDINVTMPPAPTPKKLDELEMMKLQVHFLKVQNLKLQGDKLQEDLIRCNTLIREEQEKLKAFREQLNTKYNIDLDKFTIQNDGTMTPGAYQLPANLLERIQGR